MSFFGLDISEEEVVRDFMNIRKTNNRDGRICICGHGMGFHSFIEARGINKCNAQKQSCPCKKPRPVLITTNVKSFLYKTQGSGGLHALTQGILAAKSGNYLVEWTAELKCDKCGKEDVVPCPITQNGRVVYEATGYDAFLCRDCRVSL